MTQITKAKKFEMLYSLKLFCLSNFLSEKFQTLLS